LPPSEALPYIWCSNDCSISGPFRCCTLLDTCGCSWAPGAYCL
jgi:hypothetical protein